jgi:hypothetical protein
MSQQLSTNTLNMAEDRQRVTAGLDAIDVAMAKEGSGGGLLRGR